MNFRVKLTEQAIQELRGIFEYIAYELQSPLSAELQIEHLERGVHSLEYLPDRFSDFLYNQSRNG